MAMISNNLKLIGGIISVILWTAFVWVNAITYQKNKDNVVALKLANYQLITLNNQKDKIINTLNQQAKINESANNDLNIQLDTIKSEYDYANSIIKKYQTKLNSRTYIDSSFVRYLQYTNSGKLPSITDYSNIFESSTKPGTATGILSYTESLRKWGRECQVKYNALTTWIDDSYKVRLNND